METPVCRIFIFLPALLAQPEDRHGGSLAVIGDIPDDGEPGPTIGAVDEGVVVASVSRIEELFKAIIASGDVRGYLRTGNAGLSALKDTELRIPCGWNLGCCDS
jgi:hypothetical protein